MALGWLLVLATVLLTVAGQLLIKWQVSRAMQAGGSVGMDWLLHLLGRPWIWVGLGLAFGAALAWMLALTRLPLSQAYPFTALALVLVVLAGAWWFGEPLGAWRLAGVAVVAIGVWMVGTS
jgi:multidrug transporter EmrE-like cation transporter